MIEDRCRRHWRNLLCGGYGKVRYLYGAERELPVKNADEALFGLCAAADRNGERRGGGGNAGNAGGIGHSAFPVFVHGAKTDRVNNTRQQQKSHPAGEAPARAI